MSERHIELKISFLNTTHWSLRLSLFTKQDSDTFMWPNIFGRTNFFWSLQKAKKRNNIGWFRYIYILYKSYHTSTSVSCAHIRDIPDAKELSITTWSRHHAMDALDQQWTACSFESLRRGQTWTSSASLGYVQLGLRLLRSGMLCGHSCIWLPRG